MSIFDITLAKEGFQNKLRWLSCLFLFEGKFRWLSEELKARFATEW